MYNIHDSTVYLYFFIILANKVACLLTVTLSITTFQTINLTGSNRSRTHLLVLLLRLLNPHISLLFSNLSTALRSTNASNINFFLLPTKFLQPLSLSILTILSLFNPFAVPAPHLLSPFLAHQPSHWKSQIAHSDASPRLWNQLPDSFRQPRQLYLDSPHLLVSSSLSSSPLSSFITPSLFHLNLKTIPFQQILPTLTLLLPWIAFTTTGPDRTYHASPYIFSSFA